MLEEHRRRLEALVGRVSRRGDYGTLLLQGEIVRSVEEVDSPEEWLAMLRLKARDDGLRISTHRSAQVLYARLVRERSQEELVDGDRLTVAVLRATERAQRLGHRPAFLADGVERAVLCEACGMDGYLDAVEDVMDGDVFDLRCEMDSPSGPTLA